MKHKVSRYRFLVPVKSFTFKILFLLFMLSPILLLNSCVIPVNYHGNYRKYSYLDITTEDIIKNLKVKGFQLIRIDQKKDINIYVFIKDPNAKAYNVRVYAKSIKDRVNLLEINYFVPNAYKRGYNSDKEISRHLLPWVIFNNIKRDFAWLECSYYTDFLMYGFECENKYRINHAGIVPGSRDNVYRYDYISTIIIEPLN